MTRFVEHPGLSRGFPFPEHDPPSHIAIRPLGFVFGAAAEAVRARGSGRALAGGPAAYTHAELFVEADDCVHHAIVPVDALAAWADATHGAGAAVIALVERIAAPRPPFAGIAMDRPRIMGIVNVTPDSFSDGGAFADADAAVAHGTALIEAGADLIDIGGESTRPGADPTPYEVELDRILPVIRRLAGHGVPLSIDTRRGAVMRAALDAGAAVVNDTSALTDDRHAMAVVSGAGAHVILMHRRGEPRTMQDSPAYDHAPYEIWRYLRDRVAACEAAGIPRHRIAVDPGIGFGKTHRHNVQLIASLSLFHGLGCAVALGASRKLSGGDPASARLAGSLAATMLAAAQGVQLHRVHDVAETRQALALMTRMHAAS